MLLASALLLATTHLQLLLAVLQCMWLRRCGIHGHMQALPLLLLVLFRQCCHLLLHHVCPGIGSRLVLLLLLLLLQGIECMWLRLCGIHVHSQTLVLLLVLLVLLLPVQLPLTPVLLLQVLLLLPFMPVLLLVPVLQGIWLWLCGIRI
jgi:hypothetical protein